jgi:hypothetical protein
MSGQNLTEVGMLMQKSVAKNAAVGATADKSDDGEDAEFEKLRTELRASLAKARTVTPLSAERAAALDEAEKTIDEAESAWEISDLEDIINPPPPKTVASAKPTPSATPVVAKPSRPKMGERGFGDELRGLIDRINACVLADAKGANPILVAELDKKRNDALASVKSDAEDWGLDSAEKNVETLEKRFREIAAIEAARAKLAARVRACDPAPLKTIRRDLVDAFEKQQKDAAATVTKSAPPEAAEKVVAALEARLAVLVDLEAKRAKIAAARYNGTVHLMQPGMRLAGIDDSNLKLITVTNADDYADLIVRDDVVFTGLIEVGENMFEAMIVSTSANRPENPLAKTPMDANKVDLFGGRAREHYGPNDIHLDASRPLATTSVMVNDAWVKDAIVRRGASATSRWNTDRKEWNYQIAIDVAEWKKFHIMFWIEGDRIKVFHVGPGG